MTEALTTPPEYVPFDMNCSRCEYEPSCFIPLKVMHKLTRKWYQLCQQGRKRRNCRQMTIGEILEKRQSRNATLPEVSG
jgi:hypothetical protein